MIKQHFTTVTALKAAITVARQDAKVEGERACDPGMLVSRGAWLKSFDAKGELIQGECETWEFTGKAAQLQELADLLRYDTKVARITIEGGWNWYANPRAYQDCDGEPWVSEWEVVFGEKELEPAPALAMADCPKCDPINPELDEDGHAYACYFCGDSGRVPQAQADAYWQDLTDEVEYQRLLPVAYGKHLVSRCDEECSWLEQLPLLPASVFPKPVRPALCLDAADDDLPF